jgi:hypothetical protein
MALCSAFRRLLQCSEEIRREVCVCRLNLRLSFAFQLWSMGDSLVLLCSLSGNTFLSSGDHQMMPCGGTL